MIEIDVYTGAFNQATRRAAPPLGERIRISTSCDAREFDDLQTKLRRERRHLEWVNEDGPGWGIWEVVAVVDDEDSTS